MAMSYCRIILGLFSFSIIIQLAPWMFHLTLDHAFKGEYVDLQSLLHIVFTQVSVVFCLKKKVPPYLFVFSNQLLKTNLYNSFIQEGIETTVFQ